MFKLYEVFDMLLFSAQVYSHAAGVCMCWQIATLEQVYLFDILSLGSEVAFDAGLRAVMQSARLQKVCTVAVCLSRHQIQHIATWF